MATYTMSQLKLVFYFFVNYLKTRVDHIDSMSGNELMAMFNILDSGFPFYYNMNNNYSPEFFESMMKDIFQTDQPVLTQTFSRLSQTVNPFYKYMLTFLQTTNFFQVALNHLSSPSIEYDRYYYVLGNLLKICSYYDIVDKALIGDALVNANVYYGKLFETGQIKDLSRQNLDGFIYNNMGMSLNSLHVIEEEIDNKSEPFYTAFTDFLKIDLNIIYFLILSKNLEKRVIGMKYLIDIIHFIIQQEKVEGVIEHKQVLVKKILLFKKANYLEWLEKINIFQVIFGENIHEAVLKKSSLVLIFLYINNKLSFEQINYIWEFSLDKHQAISDSILSIFSDLISSLSIEHAMFILKIINEKPYKEVNDVTLKILDSFANNKNLSDKAMKIHLGSEKSGENISGGIPNPLLEQNINKDILIDNKSDDIDLLLFNNEARPGFDKDLSDFKSYYLKILWKYSSENSFYSGLATNVILKARKILSQILLKPVFKTELAKGIKKCIIGIGCNHLLSTNLAILENIIKNMRLTSTDNLQEILTASFGQEIKDMKSFLNHLERQYCLTSTILHAVIDVKKDIMVMATEIMNLQNNYTNDKAGSINDILNNYEVKHLDSDKFFRGIQPGGNEESKENILGSAADHLMDIELEYDHRGGPLLIENESENRGNIGNNLDETLSTEKSFDNTISTISTDISSLEKSRIFILRDFLESNLSLNHSYQDNYDIIFKRLKLNFTNANYYKLIHNLLEFLKNVLFASNILVSQNQIEYLFILLVENAVDEEEMNLFYFFFAEIVRYQMITKQNYISDDNLNNLFFDILLRMDIASLPISAFNLFKQFFFYTNSLHNNILLMNQKIVNLQDFSQLIGFETLWKFYLETNSNQTFNESQNLLVNLISTAAKRADNRDSFMFIFDKIFNNLETFYTELTVLHNNKLFNIDSGCIKFEEQTKRLLNLLFIVNSTRQKIDKPKDEQVNVNIHNSFFSNEVKRCNISVNLEMTVKELKSEIINKVLYPNPTNDPNNKPPIDESYLLLIYRGSLLRNDKLNLRDLRFENNGIIIVNKGDESLNEVEIDEGRLNELVCSIKFMMEFDDEVIKRALKKNNYNPDDTVIYLTDDNNLNAINREIQEDNIIPINDAQSKLNIELFNTDKINLLINLLDLDSVSINKYIWQLFSAIKFPHSIIESLIEPGLISFNDIFDYSKPNRLLLYLRLINCLIFNDKYFTGLTRLDEVKRNEWKMNLLISGGIGVIIDLVRNIINHLDNINSENYCHIVNLLQSMQIVTKWLHYFTFSTAISLSPNKEALSQTIKQVFYKRPQGVHIGVVSTGQQGHITPKNSSSQSQHTPTFGSPHSSFSEGIKSKKLNITGAEEYENNYEEELCNGYYLSLITTNFHLTILAFIKVASKQGMYDNYYHENEHIYLNLLEILIILNEMNPEAFRDVINYEVENSIILNLLFIEKSKYVRKIVENIFTSLTVSKSIETFNNFQITIRGKVYKNVKEILMIHILNNYERIYSGQVYEEFFNLFGYILVNFEKNMKNDNISIDVVSLSTHILSMIFKLSEKYDDELSEIELEQLSGNIYLFQCLIDNYDSVLVGILDNFSQANNVNIVEFLYKNLFYIEENIPVSSYGNIKFKYSSKYLRNKVYDLLKNLIKIRESYKKDLAMYLMNHHKSFKNQFINTVDIDIGFRNKNDKFIGLQNYGATCYINSLLQQLYMIPEFRSGILNVPILENKELFQDLESNPVYQLQLVFANLSYSIKQYHTPLHFIQSIKYFNNQPINVSQQQDCEEFLNILIDRLESVLKVIGQEDVLDNSIRGRLSSEVISLDKDFPYYSEQETPSLNISIEIKNKRTIEDALDQYVKGEIIEGYDCEKHGKKINILKRNSIKKLSKNVVIHIKRFEFDYNTFEKVKLNDYFEFPMVIDFKPWMRSSILYQNKDDPNFKDVEIDYNEINDTEGFKYQLTGVLVHLGTSADSGHYYSYIYDPINEKWFEYNDSRISDFNLANLKLECFGEDKDGLESGSRPQNAYLLFYSKVTSIETHQQEVLRMNLSMPENLLSQIKQDNIQFLKYKTYLDNDYYVFLRDFLDHTILKNKVVEKLVRKEKSMSKKDKLNESVYINTVEIVKKSGLEFTNPEHMEQIKKIYIQCIDEAVKSTERRKSNNPASFNLKKKIIKLGIYFYFEVLVEHKDKNKSHSYANFLRELLDTDTSTACWFIKTMVIHKDIFIDIILANGSGDVRDGISRIIINCIYALYNDEMKYLKEKFSYFVLLNREDKECLTQREEYRSSLMRFFKNNLLDIFDDIRVHWRRYNQFLQILLECFNNQFFETVELAMEENMIRRVIYFIMNNIKGFETDYLTMGQKNIEPNVAVVIDILAVLILSCITEGIYKVKKYSIHSKYQGGKNMLNLPVDWKLLLDRNVLGNTIMKKYSDEYIPKMIHHLSWGNEEVSKTIINMIISLVKE
jgi:ubiquitin C-terminal hydrolase